MNPKFTGAWYVFDWTPMFHHCLYIYIFILLHYSFVARGNISTKYTSSSKLIWYCINVIWTIPYTNFQELYNQWTLEWIHNLCKQQIELRMSGIILEVALFLYWYIILKSSCRQFKLFLWRCSEKTIVEMIEIAIFGWLVLSWFNLRNKNNT